MSNFIQRLEDLKKKQAEQINEKNKLEALISVKKDSLVELKKELESKGLEYDTAEELEKEINERKEYLETKISNLESTVMANNDLIGEQQPDEVVNDFIKKENSQKLTLDFDM